MPDDDFGLLLDEPEDDMVVFDLPDDKPKEDPSERLRQMEIENAALKAARVVPRYEDTYTPPTPQARQPEQTYQHQPQVDQSVFNAQMGADLLTKPAEILNNYSAATLKIAKNQFEEALTPLKAGYVRQNIMYYKQNAGMDQEVAKQLDTYIKSANDAQLASLDPNNINEYLDNLHNLAIGATVRKGHIPSEIRNRAPQYTGSTSGAAPGRKKEVRKLSELEREYVRVARNEWHHSDEQIKKALDEGLSKYENG